MCVCVCGGGSVDGCGTTVRRGPLRNKNAGSLGPPWAEQCNRYLLTPPPPHAQGGGDAARGRLWTA